MTYMKVEPIRVTNAFDVMEYPGNGFYLATDSINELYFIEIIDGLVYGSNLRAKPETIEEIKQAGSTGITMNDLCKVVAVAKDARHIKEVLKNEE